MKRIAKDDDWTLMCPDVCPGLSDCYGEKFEELYTKYEKEGKGIKTVKARDVWFKNFRFTNGNRNSLYAL